jgi:hypothetical protein
VVRRRRREYTDTDTGPGLRSRSRSTSWWPRPAHTGHVVAVRSPSTHSPLRARTPHNPRTPHTPHTPRLPPRLLLLLLPIAAVLLVPYVGILAGVRRLAYGAEDLSLAVVHVAHVLRERGGLEGLAARRHRIEGLCNLAYQVWDELAIGQQVIDTINNASTGFSISLGSQICDVDLSKLPGQGESPS